MVPYIGVFYVANDNKLDYCGSLIGDEIKPESLNQALILACDMFNNYKEGAGMEHLPELTQIPNF